MTDRAARQPGRGGGVRDLASRIRRAYEADDRRPLKSYAVVLGTYGALAGIVAAVGRACGSQLPERFGLGDTVLLGVATHKASRLLAKEAVTSPLRAPFTRYERPTGAAEVNESVRGSGAQKAVGELLTCPFCLSVWMASGFTAGLVFVPRVTRLVATALTAVAVSDTLQIGYDAAKQLLERMTDNR